MQMHFKEKEKSMLNDEKKNKKNNGNLCFSTNQMFKKQTYKRMKKKRLELVRVNPTKKKCDSTRVNLPNLYSRSWD